MDQAAAHLLDFSKPFDCALLDQIIQIWSEGANPQRPAADAFLTKLRENPDMWRRADAIIETSTKDASKFFILLVLKNTINTRWKVIPQDQREGIRNYIVGKIISLSVSDESMAQHRNILSQLNQTLVAILKQDWPHAWPSFIPDIVGSSKTSESLCENNMKILKLLSEDVFVFSAESMTAAKIKQMKESLNEEFSQVFHLCQLVMEGSQKPSLLLATLDTLQRFLTWIPLGYIFETTLVPQLLKFFEVPAFRTVTLDCLTEIASLPADDIPETYRPTVQQLFVAVITQLTAMIPRTVDLAALYAGGSDADKLFVERLALFLGTFFRSFLPFFELADGSILHQAAVLEGMYLLLRISNVGDEDIFKTCLEFWAHFCREMFTKGTAAAARGGVAALDLSGMGGIGGMGMGGMGGMGLVGVGGPGAAIFPAQGIEGMVSLSPVPQHAIFAEVLHQLRITVIDHMAKPEEVIVVEDDNGEIVREQTKDTEVIAQYKTMREAIVYLTHLNFEDTEGIMIEKLFQQVSNNGAHFTWTGLNTLCWAVGSISGAMSELDEKRFLVAVIRDLLKLCEEQKGKDNKAVVASNIMYIVGQYPRFLRAHWKFLKTVVNKLFEFMHEHHPGVQDMACDTFLKIAQKCKRKFMTPQTEDPDPFILILIRDIRRHIADLAPHQMLSFFESVGTMLSDTGQPIAAALQREAVVLRLMDVPNETWRRIMIAGQQDPTALSGKEVTKDLSTVLRVNCRVCSSAGSIFIHQLSTIFLDMLNLYRFYGTELRQACATHGPMSMRYTEYKAMRTVKSDILELMICFFEASRDLEGGPQGAMQTFLPSLMEEVLGDYRAGPSVARESKVLTLFCTIVSVLKEHVSAELPRVMEAIFEPTLEMITSNMLDNPDFRLGFFRFLRVANEHCFYGLFSISAAHQKLVIDSIVWAIKHTERNIAETGLEILQELLQNIVKSRNPQFAQPFYAAFLLSLIQEVLGVMTDRLHKSGFKLQAAVLMHLFHLVQAGEVQVPLYDPGAGGAAVDNAHFLKEHVARLLLEAFPNLTTAQIVAFVGGLFDVHKDLYAFKQHLRDFLVTYNVHESDGSGGEPDNSAYYDEEAVMQSKEREAELRSYQESVPGLLKPSELAETDDF